MNLKSIGIWLSLLTSSCGASPAFTNEGRTSAFPFLSGGSRILAKNQEETTNLEVAAPLSQTATLNKDREAPLLADIELLSDILSDLVKTEDPTVHDLYEEFRQYGLDRAADPDNEDALKKMIARAATLTADQAVGVMRVFSIMLNLLNSAEIQHRTRVTRQHEIYVSEQQTNSSSPNVASTMGSSMSVGPLPLTEDSMRGTMDALLQSGTATPDQIYQQLLTQKVEIVLTAHPTQVQRKSLLRKYRKISETLAWHESARGFEKTSAQAALRRIVSSIWGADEIRRSKPTPQQEAAGGNAVIESVLWDAVPAYLRKLHTQCAIQLGKQLPVDVVPIKFASWIGGDRDGEIVFVAVYHCRICDACISRCCLALHRKPQCHSRGNKRGGATAETSRGAIDNQRLVSALVRTGYICSLFIGHGGIGRFCRAIATQEGKVSPRYWAFD
jgi:Phosphoenolpyruvate carboxylase